MGSEARKGSLKVQERDRGGKRSSQEHKPGYVTGPVGGKHTCAPRMWTFPGCSGFTCGEVSGCWLQIAAPARLWQNRERLPNLLGRVKPDGWRQSGFELQGNQEGAAAFCLHSFTLSCCGLGLLCPVQQDNASLLYSPSPPLLFLSLSLPLLSSFPLLLPSSPSSSPLSSCPPLLFSFSPLLLFSSSLPLHTSPPPLLSSLMRAGESVSLAAGTDLESH